MKKIVFYIYLYICLYYHMPILAVNEKQILSSEIKQLLTLDNATCYRHNIRKKIISKLKYLKETDEVLLNDKFKLFFNININKIDLETLINIIFKYHIQIKKPDYIIYEYYQKPIYVDNINSLDKL